MAELEVLKGQDVFQLWLKGQNIWNKWVEDNPDAKIEFSSRLYIASDGSNIVNFDGFHFPKGGVTFSKFLGSQQGVSFKNAIFLVEIFHLKGRIFTQNLLLIRLSLNKEISRLRMLFLTVMHMRHFVMLSLERPD